MENSEVNSKSKGSSIEPLMLLIVFHSKKLLTFQIHKCTESASKVWFPYNRNGTGGSVQGRVRLRYLHLVCGAAGTVQSGKSNVMSL